MNNKQLIVLMITISIVGILWSVNGWHVFWKHGTGLSWMRDVGLWQKSTDYWAADRSWPEKALTSAAGNLPIMLRAVSPRVTSWETVPAKMNGPLTDPQMRAMQAHVFGQKYAWLMIMGLHIPLLALLLTSIRMVAGFRSKPKSRILQIAPLLICVWGMLLLAGGHQQIASEPPYSSFSTCLSGAFFIWLALGVLYSLLTLTLLSVCHGPKLVWYMLKPGSLRIKCPECGRSLRGATREMIGDTGVCHKCKAEFTIEDKGNMA